MVQQHAAAALGETCNEQASLNYEYVSGLPTRFTGEGDSTGGRAGGRPMVKQQGWSKLNRNGKKTFPGFPAYIPGPTPRDFVHSQYAPLRPA